MTRHLLTVSIPDQTLTHAIAGEIHAVYPVSTSKYGIGSEEGSYKTPLGDFQLQGKIGDGVPTGTIFKGRQPIGTFTEEMRADPAQADPDHILTRIIRLAGRSLANANTFQRYIYIHGTPAEHLIGTPASHGCIRMRGDDLIELFDAVPDGSVLKIIDSPLPAAPIMLK